MTCAWWTCERLIGTVTACWVACVLAVGGAWADPEMPGDDAAAWLEDAAIHARRITGVGDELTWALQDKGEALAVVAGYQRQLGRDDAAAENERIVGLCVRALRHEQLDGWVLAHVAEAAARVGDLDGAKQAVEPIENLHERAMAQAMVASLTHEPEAFEDWIGQAVQTKALAIDPANGQADPGWTWYEIVKAIADRGQLQRVETLIDHQIKDPAARGEALGVLAVAQARSGDVRSARATIGLAYQAHDEAVKLFERDELSTGDPDMALVEIVLAHAAVGEYGSAGNLGRKAQTAQMQALSLVLLTEACLANPDSGQPTDAMLAEACGMIGADEESYYYDWTVRQLGRVAATYGRRQAVADWLATSDDPQLRTFTSLGVAEGLIAKAELPERPAVAVVEPMDPAASMPSTDAKPSDAPDPVGSAPTHDGEAGPAEVVAAVAGPAIVAGVDTLPSSSDLEPEPGHDPEPEPTAAAPAEPVAVPDLPVQPHVQLPHDVLLKPDLPVFTRQAPDTFDVEFTTSAGAFTVRVHRGWSPLAADRFHGLCEAGFYEGCRFFRVLPGFAAQWGIHGDPEVAAVWRRATFADEPVQIANTRGTVAFAAASVPDSRSTQVFVNLTDNPHLNELCFAPFGEVVSGMDTVESLFAGYGDEPSEAQRQIQLDGNAFLDGAYPKLDEVTSVRVIDR